MIQDAIVHIKTIDELINWIYFHFDQSDIYFGHGSDNAWDETVFLVLQTLNLPYDLPQEMLDSRVKQEDKALALARAQKRINDRIPLPYLTNKAYFCGSEYYVDERVLIPRSPIAELIENRFAPWIDGDSVNNILDLCTGSGCIAIACAQYFEQANVMGSDISAECIEIAKQNAKNLQVNNVNFLISDLFDKLPDTQYDIIVSNPPYVNQHDFDTAPDEFSLEPAAALLSGQDGLDITRQILKEASKFLSNNGILVVEVGNSADALEQAFPNVPFVWLEFERGGDGVFVLTRDELLSYF